MYNWSTDTAILKKDKEQYVLWKLEQLLNYGLGDEKLNRAEVRKYWRKLYLDPKTKKYLAFLLWQKKPRF